jgi:hypothetical protein
MSNSILNVLAQQLGGDVVNQLSQQLGTDPQSTQTAVNTALPLLLSALGRNTQDPQGAQSLFNAVTNDHNGSILNDVTGFLTSGGNPQAGNGILGHVLGNARPAVEQGVAQASGLDQGAAGQLLTMLAPLVMGGLGQAQQQQGLDVSGLASLLGGAREHADSQLGGLASLLDMNHDGSIMDEVLSIGSKVLGGLFGRK